VKDQLLLSLDSSGAPLYLRGLKTQGGRAPLRETLGSAILMAAGYKPGMVLLDPMTGTGTFAMEAALMAAGRPPGWHRDFSFQSWPAFQPGRWRHLRRLAEERFVSKPDRPLVLSMDLDGTGCRMLAERLHAGGLKPWVEVVEGDFFKLTFREVERHLGPVSPGLIVLNPPYGLRLEDPRACIEIYRNIGHHLTRYFRGWRLALILPPQIPPEGFPVKGSVLRFSHGSLPMKLLTGRI
jgi:putative N6-adenine-specific DNA methylase